MRDATASRCFVVWAEDRDLAFPCLEQRFWTPYVDPLIGILAVDADDRAVDLVYWVDDAQLDQLIVQFGVSAEFSNYDAVAVEPCRRIRDVPYLIHTRYELFLMLEGRKPLAVFKDRYPSSWLDGHLQPFEKPVNEARLIRRIVDGSISDAPEHADAAYGGVREVYFSVPGEEWRVDAYRHLWFEAEKSGWNDALERREGELLGYENWQNDWWIADRQQV